MLPTSSSGSPTWMADMTYNPGTNEELLTPVTPVNNQQTFQDFAMWTM
ncbi:9300_t:CDS:1, partial [Scutellospora calospora]